MAEKFAYPVVSILVLNEIGEVLLQERWKPKDQFHRFLELPQGRLRRGETLLDCARRELVEETGMSNFQPIEPLQSEHVSGAQIQMVQGTVAGFVGKETYLAVCIIGRAAGEPQRTGEARLQAWYSTDAVQKLLADGRIFPLNLPFLQKFVSSEPRTA